MGPPSRSRGARHVGPPSDDLVPALRTLRNGQPDPICRNTDRRTHRPADLLRSAQRFGQLRHEPHDRSRPVHNVR